MLICGHFSFAQSRTKGTCDIYAAGGTPCVAAHSSTRALYAAYKGSLYQVIRQSDNKLLDIGILTNGYVNAASQDAFCAGTTCLITKIYDQSGKGNHLTQAPPGTYKGTDKAGYDNLPIADMAPITINGHKAYGVFIMPGMGLRNNNARDLAINDEPEGIYYVIDGKHYDSGCCFDYGNSSTNSRAVGTGTMETTYYGTSTAWGSGNGNGPWIMSDMEAGLFSGYNAKKNDVPSIDSWRFVTAVVDGGGGNKWDLRGGNAQKGGLTTYYDGVRPGTPGSNAYYPMNKKGGILLGNGGDNGAGSSGTFYEGVMTTGYPTMATTDAVQANIVAAKYDVQRVNITRATTFSPKSTQSVTVTFNNTTGAAITGLKLSMIAGKDWSAVIPGTTLTSKAITGTIEPGASVSITFNVTSPTNVDAGFLTGRAEWKNRKSPAIQSQTINQQVRNVNPVKINEVRFSTGANPTDQFIELYNASDNQVDISNWTVTGNKSEWGANKPTVIPAGTKINAHGFYLLGLAPSGLLANANAGDKTINVYSTTGLEAGKQVNINGETNTIASVGTAPSPATYIYIPVSTSTRLNFPIGTTNLPVTNANGFTVGQKIGIDVSGNYEVATVTAVGKAGTQANLAAAAKAGEQTIKVTDNSNITVGDRITINTGARVETVKVKRIISVSTGARGAAPGEVELEAPLKFNHMNGVDVFEAGTGISFTPATKFAHKSADVVQALGTGITLQNALTKNHQLGSVITTQSTTAGYQGAHQPNLWYGMPLSATAGSIALRQGNVLVDGAVYGPPQSNSSANGTVTTPEIAVLEGDQGQGGCIIALPGVARGFGGGGTDQSNKSVGRYPDGNDTDSNCHDFQLQTNVTLAAPVTAGSNNIKVASVAGFTAGQKVYMGSGNNLETVIIKTVGTAGATTIATVTDIGATVIPVAGVNGFEVGQTITISIGSNLETAIITAITPARRNGPVGSVTVSAPLRSAFVVGTTVTGSGITLNAPLAKAYDAGTQVANSVPTPGEPNFYVKKP